MAKKVAAKKKRTPAQIRATEKMIAANKKKRSVKKRSVKKRSVKKRSVKKWVSSGRPGRKRNPVAKRPRFYAIVIRDTVRVEQSGIRYYLYFNGGKFVRPTETQAFLAGPYGYMKELAHHVAKRCPDKDVFVKDVFIKVA